MHGRQDEDGGATAEVIEWGSGATGWHELKVGCARRGSEQNQEVARIVGLWRPSCALVSGEYHRRVQRAAGAADGGQDGGSRELRRRACGDNQ